MESQFKISTDDDIVIIRIFGDINENTKFVELVLPPLKKIVLDLTEVKTLNSMGLKNWLQWVKKFKIYTQFVFKGCPRPVVDQMNILQGFLPMGALVESFFVPYYCSHCGHEEEFFAVRGRDFMEATVDTKEGILLTQKRQCMMCGKESELDVVPAKYFSFLKYRRS